MSSDPRTVKEAKEIVYATLDSNMRDLHDQAKREVDAMLACVKNDTIDFYALPLLITVSIRRAEEWLRKS